MEFLIQAINWRFIKHHLTAVLLLISTIAIKLRADAGMEYGMWVATAMCVLLVILKDLYGQLPESPGFLESWEEEEDTYTSYDLAQTGEVYPEHVEELVAGYLQYAYEGHEVETVDLGSREYEADSMVPIGFLDEDKSGVLAVFEYYDEEEDLEEKSNDSVSVWGYSGRNGANGGDPGEYAWRDGRGIGKAMS